MEEGGRDALAVEGSVKAADLDGDAGRVHQEVLEDGGLHAHWNMAMQVGELQVCRVRRQGSSLKSGGAMDRGSMLLLDESSGAH